MVADCSRHGSNRGTPAFISSPPAHLNHAVLSQEYKIHNADVLFKEDCTADDLIDVIEVSCKIMEDTRVANGNNKTQLPGNSPTLEQGSVAYLIVKQPAQVLYDCCHMQAEGKSVVPDCPAQHRHVQGLALHKEALQRLLSMPSHALFEILTRELKAVKAWGMGSALRRLMSGLVGRRICQQDCSLPGG